MTNDLVKRLRDGWTEDGMSNELDEDILLIAADRIEELEAALRRLLLEFDFLIEGGHLPDIRNDIIFDDARTALGEK